MQKQFLDNTGLTELLDELGQYLKGKQDTLIFDTTPTSGSTNPVTSGGIKTALDEKANKTQLPLIVLYDGGQCDTSIADIYAAFLAGRDVEMNYGNIFKLSLVQCSKGGALFSANFGDQSIGLKGTNSNGTDTWEFSVVDLQERLNSGTNIKTVNNNSLLGSGNVSVQPTLVSGTNIKTINNESLLGSGNITVGGGGGSDWNISYDGSRTSLIFNNQS